MHPETGSWRSGLRSRCSSRNVLPEPGAELADPGPSLADVLAVAEAEEAAFLACPDWPGTGPDPELFILYVTLVLIGGLARSHEITRTAPSRTLTTRSTSAMKSGWPKVSIRLTVTPSTANDTTADLISALALERQRISLRRACIDTADLVDDAGGVQKPLGQSGLTGIYMCQNAQVEHSSRQGDFSRRR